MPDKHVYEYAILRLVPRVDRGECINVGVVLFSKSLRFLGFKYILDEARVAAFSPETDIKEVKEHLLSFQKICDASKDSGLIGQQDQASRFRWLTAKRSTILQASEIHPGYADNPQEALNCIFEKMVV